MRSTASSGVWDQSSWRGSSDGEFSEDDDLYEPPREVPERRVARQSRRSRRMFRTSESRADSEIAREIQARLDNPEDDYEEEDRELARRLQDEDDPTVPGIRRVRSTRQEVEDENLAQAIMSADREEARERRSRAVQAINNDKNDYLRPERYEPWFCRFIFFVTVLFLFLEIAQNGFKFESFTVNPSIGPSVETLVAMGAKSTELILEGQWWRLFTPMVLHAGILHLLFNMVGLINIGFPAEREFGSIKIGLIYVASGVFGVLFSAIMVPEQVGVGASGAIFGLFGSAWADLIHNWSLYRGQAKCILLQLAVATLVNLGFGLIPFLDNYAHLGGFICGMILGFTLLVQNRYDAWGFRKARKTYQLVIQAIAITAVPVLFAVLLLILYLEVDIVSNCSFCASLSCVAMPPGAAEEDLWWDCHPCSQSPTVVTPKVNNPEVAYSISCPDKSEVFVPTDDVGDLTFEFLKENTDLIRIACKTFCPDR